MPTFGDSTVSVCTPVYNGSDYIEESIRSILSQTYTNFKLIVCDNCSTDNTEEIVRSFSDPRITYSRNQTNLGENNRWPRFVLQAELSTPTAVEGSTWGAVKALYK